MKLTTTGTVFYFNVNYYKHLGSVAMGSSLGPALSNVFLCHHERKWLRECPSMTFFLLLKSEKHVNNLLLYLNSKHPNISLTCEIEKNRSLAFLDISVYRGNNKFETSVHRKSTFSVDHLLELNTKVV